MNPAFEIGGVGLASQQRALDILASNIANLNTPAFKRLDVQFSEMLAQRSDPKNLAAGLGSQASPGGVIARAFTTLSEPGEIERTGKPMDLAINGDGLIELIGPRGQTLLWRGGPLTVQDDGLLGAGNGLALRAMITVPDDAKDLRINPEGVVTAQTSGSDERVDLGEIALVRINDVTSLEPIDGGFYRAPDSLHLTQSAPGEDGAGLLVQGAIERSNVELNDEMIRLMIVQRSYAANAQVVQAADQLASIANNLRR